MPRVPALIFLLFLLTAQALSDCPTGWTQLVQSDKCVAAFGTQLAYFDAMLYCQNIAPGNAGSLVSIHSAFQNAQLAALGQQTSMGCPLWIGLYDFDDSGHYSWTDATNVDYTNWAAGYPTASAEDTAGFMNLNLKNRWEDTNELSAETCFFCQQNSNQAIQTTTRSPVTTAGYTTTQMQSCREGWSRFGDSCYQSVKIEKTFVDALVYCEAEGAHLARLKTQDQIQFAKDLVNISESWSWIGLTKSTDGEWKWTDGEALSEERWCTDIPGWADQPDYCCGPGPIDCGLHVDKTNVNKVCLGDHGCEVALIFICEYEA